MAEAGIDPTGTSLKVAVLGAEPWTHEMRAEIQRRPNIDAVDIYGLSEVMGHGVASESVLTKDGQPVSNAHFLPATNDRGSGEPGADGAPGELLLTSTTEVEPGRASG